MTFVLETILKSNEVEQWSSSVVKQGIGLIKNLFALASLLTIFALNIIGSDIDNLVSIYFSQWQQSSPQVVDGDEKDFTLDHAAALLEQLKAQVQEDHQ